MPRLLTAIVLTAAASCVAVGVVVTPASAAPRANHRAAHSAPTGQDDFVFDLADHRPNSRSLRRTVDSRSLVRAKGQTQWISCKGPGTATTPTPPSSAPTPEPSASSSAAPTVTEDPPKSTGPTVVLVAGLGASHSYWDRVRSLLRPTTRVCWYDRPGLGYSPARVGRRVTTARQARELNAALAATGETGKYILVGHSYGGLLARSFANQYRSQTAGLVLVDASYSTQWRYSGKYWSEGGATINMKRTQRDTYGRPRMGSKPLFVIGAGRGNSSQWQRMQAVAARLGRNSVHVTARRSTHVVMASNPKIVATAITEVVAAAPNKHKLKSCRKNLASVWAPLGGFCGRRR
ncbi:MAG: alpha/beta fold hydrolase [Candidatus Nanopelagicales bacterium]